MPAEHTVEPRARRFRRKQHHLAEREKRLWDWVKSAFVALDKPFRFAGTLSLVGIIIGIIGTSIGMYFQYTAWREEKELTRYKEDFTNATVAFSELSQTFSSVMNLQQILFYLYREALDDGKDGDRTGFLS